MNEIIKKCSIVLFCLIAVSCAKKTIVQDEKAAIDAASNFLKAIMHQEYQIAYDKYLSPGIKYGPKATVDYFKADWEAIREKYGQITKATFDAWQLVPGKHAIQVYYEVIHKNVKDPVVYHIILEGHKEKGYTIFLIDIGNEQHYPPNVSELPEKHKIEETIEILP